MPLAIFDLDNTLLDRAGPFRVWAEQFVAANALDPAESQWLVTADGDGFVPRPEFLSTVRTRYGLRDSVEVLIDRFRAEIVALVEVDPRVPAGLDRLRAAGWRVAIATNGSTAQQSAKIRRTGLDAHVDAVAISEEVGAAKPDSLIFHAAAQRCGARLADGGWMVGDCATRDIAAGRDAGLRTIWLRRGRAWDAAVPAPDAIVDHVADAMTRLVTR
jgi:FMN phosphatase YigB (HAD superfamily)